MARARSAGGRHRPAAGFERLHAQQPECLMGRQHPFLMPARQDVAGQQNDLRQRQRTAFQRISRGRLCLGQIAFGLQHELVPDCLDPTMRQLPQGPPKIGPAGVVYHVRPQFRRRHPARHRPAAHGQVGEETSSRERQPFHRFDAKAADDRHPALSRGHLAWQFPHPPGPVSLGHSRPRTSLMLADDPRSDCDAPPTAPQTSQSKPESGGLQRKSKKQTYAISIFAQFRNRRFCVHISMDIISNIKRLLSLVILSYLEMIRNYKGDTSPLEAREAQWPLARPSKSLCP
jgi:hypothetical protein